LPVERIALEGLTPEAVGAMLARVSGRSQGVDAARDMHARTGGNPFYIEQLLQDAGAPPGGIAELVTRRASALGPEAGAILETAALAGPEFELSIVAEASGAALDDALDAFDAAVRARLVAEAPDEPGRGAFVHDIVRETLAGSLTAARRPPAVASSPARSARRSHAPACTRAREQRSRKHARSRAPPTVPISSRGPRLAPVARA